MEFLNHIDFIKQRLSTGISKGEMTYLTIFIMQSLPHILPIAESVREEVLEKVLCSDEHNVIGKAIVHKLDLGFTAIDQFVKDKNKEKH